MFSPVLTGIWIALLTSTTAFAQTPAQIDTVILDEMADQNIIGIAVGIVKDGEIYYARGYGYAELVPRVPVTTNTVFRWGSISKTLTAALALRIAEETPTFSLNDRVTEHVPFWPARGNKGRIRIWHLLSNRSGIIHYNSKQNCTLNRSPRYDRDRHTDNTYNAEQSVAVFSRQPLCFEPGAAYKYSTFGYSLLGAAIEGASKTRYASLVDSRIRQPLGLASLRQGTGIRTGYDLDGNQLVSVYSGNAAWKLPGGGWESDIIDLAKFANALMHGRLLDITRFHYSHVPGNSSYGFGIIHSPDNSLAWHEGHTTSSRTLLTLYPEAADRLGIVLMTNSVHSRPVRIARRLAALFPY